MAVRIRTKIPLDFFIVLSLLFCFSQKQGLTEIFAAGEVLSVFCQCSFYHDGALHTLPLELASDFIIASDILMGMISVCCASATAVESCKTILAGWLGVNIAASEILLDVRSRNPFIHISHQIFFFPNKLVAWVEIPPWSYGKIFCAASASGESLVYTRATGKVDHEMEEIKAFAFFLAFYHL